MSLPSSLKGQLELPVVGSPLFIVSGPELVIAQCKAGVVGSFPALNARPAGVLDEWLTRIDDELAEYKAKNPGKKVAPYAVNQICHASNDRLMADMETCVKHKVPIIITSLRPPSEIVEAAHSYGGVVFHDVINVKHAQKAAEQGVDGLILVCAGAGGHAGTLSPFALVREVKQWFNGTILLSGAIPTLPLAVHGPTQSGKSHFARYLVMEAIAQGAKTVSFSQPVPFYVDNFLGMPIGAAVPVGYYDHGLGRWVPEPNGRVLKVLAVNAGVADLDVDEIFDEQTAAP